MLAGISIWNLLIILAIIVLIFGTKKLRNIGQDLGGAVKGFKDAVKEGEKDNAKTLERTRETPDSVVERQDHNTDKH